MNNTEEVIFISNDQTPHIHQAQPDTTQIDSVQVCFAFSFRYKKSAYSTALQSILLRLLTTMNENNEGIESVYYRDDLAGNFTFFIRAQSNAILTCATTLSNALPLGLDFLFTEMKPLTTQAFQDEIDQATLVQHDSNTCTLSTLHKIQGIESEGTIMPNVGELHAILEPESPLYGAIIPFARLTSCALPQCLQSRQSHDFVTHLSESQLQDFMQHECLEALASYLLEHKSITMQRNGAAFNLSLQPQTQENTPYILFATLDCAQSYLRLSEAQKNMLASFEKPFVQTQCKEVFAQEFGSHTIFSSISYDIIVLLLLGYLKEKHEISFLFLEQAQGMPLLCYTDSYPSCLDSYPYRREQHTYSVAGHITINHHETHRNLAALLAGNVSSESRFIVFLSTRHKSAFYLQHPPTQDSQDSTLQQILEVSLSLDLFTHLQTLHGYQNGDRLIYNFTKTYPHIAQTWQLSSDEIQALGIHEFLTPSTQPRPVAPISHNLMDICHLIAKILNLNTSVLFEANRCVRDRGPRIDYKLVRQGDSIVLDYARLLRSVMSFHLAGVEQELLCYGVLDSLAEFVGTLAGDMFLNYGIHETFICGDMLLQQCFLEKIIKAAPTNMRAVFPQHGGCDYLD